MKIFKPKARFNKVTDIEIDFLKKNKIKGIILDVDNTLIDLDKRQIDNLENWINKIKQNNIKIYIASNSIHKKKVENIAKSFGIDYTYGSIKPLKRGLKKALNSLNLPKEEVAEVGDQLFTDVLGSNRMGLYSILTIPISEEKHFISKIKRKFEKFVLNKVLKGE